MSEFQPISEIGMFSAIVCGEALPFRFYAIFADGREERISLTFNSGDELSDVLKRTCQELGAQSIIFRQEAKVSAG